MSRVVSIQSINDTWDRLNKLAQKRGIRIFFFPEKAITVLNNDLPADGYWISEEGTTVILIGKSLRGSYRNHVLAHELGHEVLHGKKATNVAYRKNIKQNYGLREIEADRFAHRLISWMARWSMRKKVL